MKQMLTPKTKQYMGIKEVDTGEQTLLSLMVTPTIFKLCAQYPIMKDGQQVMFDNRSLRYILENAQTSKYQATLTDEDQEILDTLAGKSGFDVYWVHSK